MRSEFQAAIAQLIAEKGLPREVVMETVATALLAAYRKSFGGGENVRIEVDKNGEVHVWASKRVVAQVKDSNEEISLAEAQRLSGVNIVGTTGFYGEHNAIGLPFYWRRKSVEYMEDLIARDITEGMVYDGALTPYRAGVIKVSTGALTNTPTPIGPNGTRVGVYEERAIRAAARAHNIARFPRISRRELEFSKEVFF